MSLKLIRRLSRMTNTKDLIGPPCPQSHLRPIQLVKSSAETPLQKEYRCARLDLHSWNQTFWSKHNAAFIKEREEFINTNITPEKPTLNADEMSIFYKSFLDKNWKTHLNYNVQWYKKNISVFILSLRVFIEKNVLKIIS